MGNRKNKILVIAFITIMTLTTGCGITITRNHHYGYPDHSIKKSNNNDVPTDYFIDSLTNNKNGPN